MKRIIRLLVFCCSIVGSIVCSAQKTNVLFIGVDDLSIAFDAYGNPDAKCPNFARLAQHGMWFKNAYIQYPLCSPSRTSIFSGQRPDSTGIVDNITSIRAKLGPDFQFLPEYFHAQGYRTEKFGKFTCEHESEISWDYVFNKYVHEPSDSALGGDPVWWIDSLHKKESQTMSGTIVRDGLLPKLQSPVIKPYFYSLGLTTHTPFTPILNSWNKAGDSTVQELLPVDIYGTLTNVYGNGSANILLPDTPPNDTADIPRIALKDLLFYTPEQVQKIRHAYYSEIMQEDFHLGLVLDAMDQLQLWDSTIVVFYSDHGLHMGEHQGLWLKTTLFEESLRVPFIICAPGKKKGVSNTIVEMVDIFPTLTELCGLPKAPGMSGSSLVPLLEKPDTLWKKAAFSQVKRFIDIRRSVMGKSVRTNNFHYNYWQQYGEELYDIVNDPKEYTNLVNDTSYAADLAAMRTLLAKGWQYAKPPAYKQKFYFRDADADGYGLSADSTMAYFAPDGFASLKGDCNDNNPAVNPSAPEQTCNGLDDNCNNKTDENNPEATISPLGNLDICAAGYVDLAANDGIGLTYKWRRDNKTIAGATSRIYRANITGNYKVIVVQPDGCTDTSRKVIVTSTLCGKSNLSGSAGNNIQLQQPFVLYPNPVNDILHIRYESSVTISSQLRIFDLSGKLLSAKNVGVSKGANLYELDVSRLKAGAYYFELISGASPQRLKFMVVH